VPYPSSEAEFHLRVARADCSGRSLGPPGPWAPATDLRLFLACFTFVSSFMFCYLRKRMGFPQLFRGPLWLSPTSSQGATKESLHLRVESNWSVQKLSILRVVLKKGYN
jgi:hypothetical protein